MLKTKIPFYFYLLVAAVAVSCSVDGKEDTYNIYSDKFVNSPSRAIDGTLLLLLKEGKSIDSIQTELESIGAGASAVFQSVSDEASRRHRLDRWYQLTFSGTSVEAAAKLFAGSDAVEKVEFDKPVKGAPEQKPVAVEPVTRTSVMSIGYDDPLFVRQWNLYNNGSKTYFGNRTVAGADVNVKDAWRIASGDPAIIVAIVDDAVKYTHPDLAANMWTNQKEAEGEPGMDDDGNGFVDDVHGYNFVSDGALRWESAGTEGHGTHVAGLVGAVNNNGIGISSIAGGSGNGDGIRLMSCQIFEGSKIGSMAVNARAIKYAADNGASVLQCSWGGHSGEFLSDAQYARGHGIELDALEYFLDPGDSKKYNSGVITDGNIVIFSAGNDYGSIPSYPGAYYKFVCVTAFSQDYLPAWYTNYGPGANISAPGGDNNIGPSILSTLPDEVGDHMEYGYMHGTSQATPQVSSIAALGLSYARKLGKKFTRQEFISMLLTSVDEMDSRLEGYKLSGKVNMPLESYKGKMGTGTVDTWKFLMQIEGTPFATVRTGETSKVSLTPYFGGGAASLTYLGVEMTQAEMDALGVTGTPVVKDGALEILCSKAGSGKLTVRAIAGGTSLGGDKTGGMEISKTISIMSRGVAGGNNGWL